MNKKLSNIELQTLFHEMFGPIQLAIESASAFTEPVQAPEPRLSVFDAVVNEIYRASIDPSRCVLTLSLEACGGLTIKEDNALCESFGVVYLSNSYRGNMFKIREVDSAS